jgi:glycosyltransferase involved in cell wall biosynthesis
MKLALIGPAYPLRGGNALFVGHLAEALSEEHDVYVVSYSRLYPKFLFPGTRMEDVSKTSMKATNPDKTVALIDCVNPVSWKQTADYINRLKPDLVVVTWWNSFFGAAHRGILSFLDKATPVFYIAENVVSHESSAANLFLTRLALDEADYFMTLSHRVAESIAKLYPAKPVFEAQLPIYDCYNLDADFNRAAFATSLNLKKNVLLFFGYVREYKGLMFLLDAMPDILERLGRETTLLIVGEFYDKRQKYDEKISALGLEENVKIVSEFVPNEEVGRYFSVSDLVVMPYISGTQSGILNIAYGFRKPVVITNVGGISETVIEGKTGFIIEPRNPKAIADATIKFYASKSEVNFERNIQIAVGENNFKKTLDIFRNIARELDAKGAQKISTTVLA